MPDEIARLSEALARDPAGMGWVPLAEALRRARRLSAAERTALRGLERHPYHADGHDVLARIAADGGDLGRARDEWEMALRLDARHVGARLGMGWLALRAGDRAGASRWLEGARELAPDDPRVVAAGRQVQGGTAHGAMPPAGAPGATRGMTPSREATPATAGGAPVAKPAVTPAATPVVPAARPTDRPPTITPARAPQPAAGRTPVTARGAATPDADEAEDRSVFGSVTRGGARFALLVDGDGLVLAGHVRDASGADSADALAAELSGLSADARTALRQLQLGAWEQLQVEGERATLSLAPSDGDSLTLVATAAGTPAGLPRLLLDRARQRANAWMATL